MWCACCLGCDAWVHVAVCVHVPTRAVCIHVLRVGGSVYAHVCVCVKYASPGCLMSVPSTLPEPVGTDGMSRTSTANVCPAGRGLCSGEQPAKDSFWFSLVSTGLRVCGFFFKSKPLTSAGCLLRTTQGQESDKRCPLHPSPGHQEKK